MDTDIDLEPEPCGSDKNVESKKQADSAIEIPETSSESKKVVPDKFWTYFTSAGLDVGILAAEFPSQLDIENYVARGHTTDFPLTLPNNGKNQSNISNRYSEVQKH